MRPRVAVAFTLAWLALALPGRAEQRPTFQGGVDLVLFDVVVLDERRQPVEGLTAADFTAIEDTRRRSIDTFAAFSLPAPLGTSTASWIRAGHADVVTNARAPEGRLVVIMMDRTILAGPQTIAARKIAHAAIDALGPNDLAAVVRNSGFTVDGKVHGFTADKVRLRAVVESAFVGMQVPPSMTSGGLVPTLPNLAETPDCLCGICVMDSITQVAEVMAPMSTRQKSLLFIGSDILLLEDNRPTSKLDCSGPLPPAREKALRALDRSNVVVHSIDTTGLETLASSAEFGGRTPRTATYNLRRQGNLGFFPGYTGGRTVVNTNTPEALVDGIFNESRSYYVIGLSRAAGASVAKPSQIRFQVNRRGVTVRNRRGYYAPATGERPESIEPTATNAVSAGLPVVDMPLAMSAVPTFTADGATEITILRSLRLPDVGPADTSATVNVVTLLLDMRGKVLGKEEGTMTAVAGSDSPGVESRSDILAEPGSYELRVGVQYGNQHGSVFGYADVPKVKDDEFALSGAMISVAGEAGAAGIDGSIGRFVPSATLRRSFTKVEAVSVSLQVRRGSNFTAPVAVTCSVVDERDRMVKSSSRELTSEAFAAGRVAVHTCALPVDELDPGRYLMRLEARSGELVQARSVPFHVR